MALFGKESVSTPDRVNTIIGKDTFFKGNINAKGIVRIDGQMEGDIETQSDVIIGEGGRVSAEVKARSLTIAGQLQGNIFVSEKLEIRSSGLLVGNVKAKVLVIDHGASFTGNCDMEKMRGDERAQEV